MTSPHVRFVVGCITLISLICVLTGSLLLLAGYQSGELLVSAAGTGLGGLIGMISMRGQTPTEPPQSVTQT